LQRVGKRIARLPRGSAPASWRNSAQRRLRPLRKCASHDPLAARDIVKLVAERTTVGVSFRHASGFGKGACTLYFSLEFAMFCLGQYYCPNW
jgi:hypothetical protein